MAYSPRRRTLSNYCSDQNSPKSSEMAMLAATPAPHAGFPKEYPWESYRESPYPSHSSQGHQSVSLPSIRHQFPELLAPEASAHPRPPSASPTAAVPGHLTSPAYVHSSAPTKRRRGSFEDEQEMERARQVPRRYRSPSHFERLPPSPTAHIRPTGNVWGQNTRAAPLAHGDSRVPAPIEVSESAEPRPSVPHLTPSMSAGFERHSGSRPPTRDHVLDDYREARTIPAQQAAVVTEPAPRYASAAYEYSYHQPSQAHPPSPPRQMHERTPFSAGPYAHGYGEYSRYSDIGSMGVGGDNKQRKRRGNLPKETTDKLRSWFMAHLSHPYPTEDEKQDLMRQTGLQMNQISNWFINARRRQLPTMISNARVETDAISGRASETQMMPGTERQDARDRHEGFALSDGEGGPYDEDPEGFKRLRGHAIERGSV